MKTGYLKIFALKAKLLLAAVRQSLHKAFSGMASSITIYDVSEYRSLEGTDADRLRSDMARIGGDFHKVIGAELDRIKKTKS